VILGYLSTIFQLYALYECVSIASNSRMTGDAEFQKRGPGLFKVLHLHLH